MASKSTELKNLNSSDEATRRKAVRWLFENDVKESLPSFFSFLSDEDIWFRERAKMAFKKWITDDDFELVERLLEDKSSENEYFLSTFLSNFSAKSEQIVVELLKSDNHLVRSNVRTFQFNNSQENELNNLMLEVLEDPDYRVRKTGVGFLKLFEPNDLLIDRIFSDSHSLVRLTALENLNLDPIKHNELIQKLRNSEDIKIRFYATIFELEELIGKNKNLYISEIFHHSEISEKRIMISELMKFKWDYLTRLLTYLFDQKKWEFLSMIAKKSSTEGSIKLRYNLAINNEVPIDYRIKLIEKLKSRINSMDLSKLIENLEESNEERLIQAGEQLRGLQG